MINIDEVLAIAMTVTPLVITEEVIGSIFGVWGGGIIGMYYTPSVAALLLVAFSVVGIALLISVFSDLVLGRFLDPRLQLEAVRLTRCFLSIFLGIALTEALFPVLVMANFEEIFVNACGYTAVASGLYVVLVLWGWPKRPQDSPEQESAPPLERAIGETER
jgi:hypothetical protein